MFRVGEADVDLASWQVFETELAATLAELQDRCFVVAAMRRDRRDLAPPEPSKSLLARVRSTAHSFARGEEGDGQPFVQARRIAHQLMAECCGPKDLKGPVDLSHSQHVEILKLGWADPHGRDKKGWAVPNYRAYFPHEETVAQIRWIKGEADYGE